MTEIDYTDPATLRELAGDWEMPLNGTALFQWDYDSTHDKMLRLYLQGKTRQWDMDERLDWSHEVDPEDPLGMPDDFISIAGSDFWNRLPEKEKIIVRQHSAGWLYSQFLHSEQFALIGVGKVCAAAESIESKMFGATQLMDEARHVEGFNRFIKTKIGIRYPLSSTLASLFQHVMADSRWDFGVLAAHALVENMGLATFGVHRERMKDPLARAFSAYVARDEARHVAFGRLLLRDYYPQLTSAEIAEREEFVLEGCWALRERYVDDDVWTRLGYDEECFKAAKRSPAKREFRRLVFMRIVPGLKDIGLLGPRVQEGLAKMGVLGFKEIDDDAVLKRDEVAAERLADLELAERKHEVQQIMKLGAAEPGEREAG
ncbi:P-aminobenzoate N-oxygenase AurF [Amycolatopsis xylanica]|uniref:p-aminobenzoate N-oxygenase AurF n=1 Tax=Amycolatopsis xylanica TaxID=589385 RepID=A0A1H2WAU0_9PSEU|nr:ferritin-like domain-containing protein [Amycolatopsis xylanica]SDW77813.1 P-aminobenzoate N-oxygenase AurF [Amycolatopsis xylanica]